MLKYETRIKIPVSNKRVFGHGGIYHQVHNEVYEWLHEFAVGTQWYERQVKGGWNGRNITGKFFYFESDKVAVLFKLAWGGDA